jgi:glycerol uptake facilitator-like aquaporin
LGIPFIAFAPFVGVAIGVFLFGKISMAHFNLAVTIGFLITRLTTNYQLIMYFGAEISQYTAVNLGRTLIYSFRLSHLVYCFHTFN